MSEENHRINLYLGSLKSEWLDYCKSLGKKPGSLLKTMIKKQMKDSKIKSFEQTREDTSNAKKQRFEVLLTTSEKAALELRARQEYTTQRDCAIKMIRAGLTKQAQFNQIEVTALGESNYAMI